MIGPPAPQRPTPGWKALLALLCLALSLLLWVDGLVSSLQRPSVQDALGLRQLELNALVADGLPEPWQPWIAGADPRQALAQQLQQQIAAAPTPAPAVQRLELALLQRGSDQPEVGAGADRELDRLITSVDAPRRPLLEALRAGRQLPASDQAPLLAPWHPSLLLQQLTCEQLGAPLQSCPAEMRRSRLLARALAAGLGPVVLLLAGSVLVIREIWLLRSGRSGPPAPLRGPPLTPIDATLLIAGGFVLLGEVLTPQLVQGPIQQLLAVLHGPIARSQGVQVLCLYLALMAAPLTLLAVLLRGHGSSPPGGWLQWQWRPVGSALGPAIRMVLMVLPAVALIGWLVDRIWQDPGGSNPLLELVLTSGDGLALLCFAITAMVLAPVFEETLFRGVLLPVVALRWGGPAAVLTSALVFALAHLSLSELTPLFVLGLGLGWLRWRSGRLSSSVLMHALWNGLTFLNLWLLAD